MSFPTSPFNGQLAVVNGINYTYNSTFNAWVRAPLTNYTASVNPPDNPTIGSIWYKTSTDVMYQYLSDGTDYYWFDMSSQTVSANTSGITSYLGETYAGNLSISGNITGSLGYMLEKTNIVGSSPPTVTNIDILNCPIVYFTGNATTNFVANLRGNSTVPLSAIVSNGQSVTFSIFVPQASAYYVNEVRIDNITIPTAWQGYAPVSTGNSNSIDLYTFTAVRGSINNWRVYASQTSYTHTGAWTDYNQPYDPIEYLVIAGGASGATSYGGGGGAGGVRYGSSFASSGTYTITVGAGGTAISTNGTNGNAGSDSAISGPNMDESPFTAEGGGRGGTVDQAGGNGGSGGGGGGAAGASGGAGGASSPVTSPVQGYAGGAGFASASGNRGAGGGGGAGGVGSAGTTSVGGNGGIGTNEYTVWATATSTGVGGYYAGGGGGGAISGTNVGGTGGTGGGGAGASGANNSGTAGTTNTGGGGGGMGDRSSSGSSGTGGSGIVIVRTLSTRAVASTTGSPTVVVDGGYRYYTFTGDGTLVW